MASRLIGHDFGDYYILEKIGSGGMATVFKAVQKDSHQKLALKVLHEQYNDSPQIRPRFEREAKISSRLEHPHIVPILDFGEFDGHFYLVMPFMEGGSLAAGLAGKAVVDYNRSLEMLTALASALDYAHSQGVVHRDFKLGNILLDKKNTPAISDFGIAQASDTTSITMTSQVLGSPQYFAPENFMDAGTADYRLDLYAFGVVAYLLFTGYFPFTGPNALSIIYKHRYGGVPLPSKVNSELPPVLDEVFSKALAKNPDERFSSAHEMVSQLNSAFVDVPAGAAAKIFLNRENPVSASTDAVSPYSNFVALSDSIPLTLNSDGSSSTAGQVRWPLAIYENLRSDKKREAMLPLHVGGWLLACVVLSMWAQILTSGLSAQNGDSGQAGFQSSQTLAMVSETFTASPTPLMTETPTATANKTPMPAGLAGTGGFGQSLSPPTAIISSTEYLSINSGLGQNSSVKNPYLNTQAPAPTNAPVNNPPPNNPAPTNRPHRNNQQATNPPPTNPPATSPPTNGSGGSSGSSGSGSGGSGGGGNGNGNGNGNGHGHGGSG